MSKLSIQDWIKNNDDYYIEFSQLKKFSNDINTYNKLIQNMNKPLDFENINNYIQYCNEIQTQLNKQKIDNHIKLTKELGMIDEFYLLNKTPSEQLLSKYLNYLQTKKVN
jgi:hypothetical protein